MKRLFSLLVVTLLCGCTHMTTQTTVKSDGAFEREVVLKMATQGFGGQANTPEKVHRAPTSAGWATTKGSEDDNLVITHRKSFGPGEVSIDDLVLLDKDKPVTSNSVRVLRRLDGTLEYVETLRWLGDGSDFKPMPAEDAKKMRSALPEGTTDEEAEKIAQKMVVELWRSIFGPGDPMLGIFLTHPSLGERRLRQQISKAASTAAGEVLGDRITTEQKRTFARLVAEEVTKSKGLNPTSKMKEKSEGEGGGESGLVSIVIAVKFDGEVVSTNGELDEASGEVFWGLYPLAAAPGTVELRAVIRPRKTN